jgi:putative ABC transport system permease protein
VALGVAVVIAIDLANASARRAFLRSAELVKGRATHQVLGGPGGLPQAVLARIRVEGELRASAPVVEGDALALDLDRQPLRILGVDPLSEAPFRPHFGEGSLGRHGLASFLTNPRAVLVGSSLADRYSLRLGSPLRLRVQDRFVTLEVAGIVRAASGDEAMALEQLLLMDVGAAQGLLRLGDRLSRVDLIATEAEAARVRALLPPGARLVSAGEQAAIVGQLTDAFSLNLTALSLLALVVGMFLIYSTVMFSVVQRRAVIGTLRLLGVTGEQVLALVLLETTAASAVGTAIGLGLGWALAQGAVHLVTRTINDLYFVVSVAGAPLTQLAVEKGVLLGLGAGAASALAPAAEAARIEPVEALRPSTFEGHARSLLPGIGAAGALLAASGCVLLIVSGRSLVASFAGLSAIVLGFALAAPLATMWAMAVASPLLGRTVGTLGRLAARTVTRSVSRTGVSIASLAVAVSVTIGIGLMIRSFRSTVENWLDLLLRADIFVAAPAAGGARAAPPLSPDVPARVAAVEGVAWVETFRSVQVASPLGDVQLAVADPRRVRSTRLLRFADGDPAAVWGKLREGAAIVSEPFAFRNRLPHHGGSVELQTDRGLRTFPVAGIYYDYATERGTVLLTRNVYERYWDDRAVSSLGVWLAPGHTVEDVTHRLRTALADRALLVTPNRSLRARALEVFDRTFAVTRSLRLLAVGVAFIGVWSALMALQVERTRDLATLETVGLTPRQMWALTLLETGLMGAVAGVLALPLGWLLAAILVNVINLRSFGWTMRLEADPWLFVEALLVSVAAALAASVYPLLRLRRRPLAAALRAE